MSAKELFRSIDTSRRFLLLSDSDHNDRGIYGFVHSIPFMLAARQYGYTKLLVETERSPAIIHRHETLSSNLGIKGFSIHPVDARTEKEKKDYFETKKIAQNEILKVQRQICGIRSSEELPIIILRLTALVEKMKSEKRRIMEKDPVTLENILHESSGGKVIVFYGASHFRKGEAIETGITPEDRNLVALIGEKGRSFFQGIQIDAELSPDTCFYNVSTGLFERSPMPEPAYPQKLGADVILPGRAP